MNDDYHVLTFMETLHKLFHIFGQYVSAIMYFNIRRLNVQKAKRLISGGHEMNFNCDSLLPRYIPDNTDDFSDIERGWTKVSNFLSNCLGKRGKLHVDI